MKKFSILLALSCLIAWQLPAQCGGKGMKALDDKDYKGAFSAFEECLGTDPNDISANFGMARLYGADPAKKDRQKAKAHLVLAEDAWAKLDEKGRAKLEKLGITTADLEARRSQIESSFLEAAKGQNTVAAYDEFLAAFPNSKLGTVCRNYRNDLAYKEAQADGSVEALDAYIARYPDAENLPTVTATRDQLASTVALKTNTEGAMENFLQRYPGAKQAAQIQQRLNAIAFENVKAENTIAAFERYIARFPDSVFIPQAQDRLAFLKSQE
jgi:hypothetical protein